VVILSASLISSPEFAAAAMVPVMLMMAAMFFTSIFFTVRDCFLADEAPTEAASQTRSDAP
jgi:hypothetical protein